MIVVEASAMVDALVDDPVNPELLALMADEELHAPALLDYEVAGALRGHALGGKLTDEQVDDAVDDFSALTIERYPLSLMIRDVLDLLHDFTVCDAAYVVLAKALDAPLVTADAKLSGARRLGVDLRVLRVTK
jgi:predicted nucleic acid-binding protein